MSRANWGQAYSVSLLMNIVRMEQVRARARWRPEPIDLRRTLAFIVGAFAMFAVFFAVGHATRGTHAASSPGTYSPRPLSSQSVHAGIPDGVVASRCATCFQRLQDAAPATSTPREHGSSRGRGGTGYRGTGRHRPLSHPRRLPRPRLRRRSRRRRFSTRPLQLPLSRLNPQAAAVVRSTARNEPGTGRWAMKNGLS